MPSLKRENDVGGDSQKGLAGIHKAVYTYLPCSLRFQFLWRDR